MTNDIKKLDQELADIREQIVVGNQNLQGLQNIKISIENDIEMSRIELESYKNKMIKDINDFSENYRSSEIGRIESEIRSKKENADIEIKNISDIIEEKKESLKKLEIEHNNFIKIKELEINGKTKESETLLSTIDHEVEQIKSLQSQKKNAEEELKVVTDILEKEKAEGELNKVKDEIVMKRVILECMKSDIESEKKKLEEIRSKELESQKKYSSATGSIAQINEDLRNISMMVDKKRSELLEAEGEIQKRKAEKETIMSGLTDKLQEVERLGDTLRQEREAFEKEKISADIDYQKKQHELDLEIQKLNEHQSELSKKEAEYSERMNILKQNEANVEAEKEVLVDMKRQYIKERKELMDKLYPSK